MQQAIIGLNPLSDVGYQDVLWSRIMAVDLEPIQIKLMYPREGRPFTIEEAMNLADRYRKFLYLCGSNFGKKIIPTREIDMIWHVHILDTEKYPEDCQKMFGRMLHHFPYFGLRGDQDEVDRVASFNETARLYESVFKERYNQDSENGSLCSSGLGGCEGDHIVPTVRPSFASFGLHVPMH